MRVLVAEDDDETVEFVRRGLGELGHHVLTAANGVDALHLAMTDSWDAIVLDRMMPGLDGLGVLTLLRQGNLRTPVLLLTALGQIKDRVEGLEAGADDYLIKPFAFSELAARLNAIARRRSASDADTTLVWGPLTLDMLKREVRCAERSIHLQPREFRLLEELMRSADRVVSRTMFLERVWGFHFDPQTNIVETHISRLRSKLGEHGITDPIETVRGSGYRLRMPR